MRRELRYAAGGAAGYVTLTTLLSSVRYRLIDSHHREPLLAAHQPVVYVLWHGRLLPLAHYHRHEGMTTLISRSGDGEYIARVVRRWGFVPVRGSSSRGGREGLLKLFEQVQQGRSAAITPDGPRGPKQKMKNGALLLAQRTGAPVMPVSAAADRAWWFESWDRFLVPKPFSHVDIVYGAPITIPPDAGPDEIEALSEHVETELNRLTEQVDAIQS
ncbi:MAG: lysophospholipid acyltransferase family protein [Gemmatimonadota bacterium]|jgi:lysophospholipid acyltransferase (LPLAT)-like uncharacterized protein